MQLFKIKLLQFFMVKAETVERLPQYLLSYYLYLYSNYCFKEHSKILTNP